MVDHGCVAPTRTANEPRTGCMHLSWRPSEVLRISRGREFSNLVCNAARRNISCPIGRVTSETRIRASSFSVDRPFRNDLAEHDENTGTATYFHKITYGKSIHEVQFRNCLPQSCQNYRTIRPALPRMMMRAPTIFICFVALGFAAFAAAQTELNIPDNLGTKFHIAFAKNAQ